VVALGLLFTPGAGCSWLAFRRRQPPYAPICSYQPFRVLNVTKPHQGFICIIPSNDSTELAEVLALACTLNLALKVLLHLSLSADTALPLLSEHSKADIRLNTSGERILEPFPTPPNDFESRV
jgi:hypothetical protein